MSGIRSDSDVAVIVRAVTLWQFASRDAKRKSTKESTVLGQNHPVEYVLTLKSESLADLMPFLQFRWNLEEAAEKTRFASW
jgi:hypothetical protein